MVSEMGLSEMNVELMSSGYLKGNDEMYVITRLGVSIGDESKSIHYKKGEIYFL